MDYNDQKINFIGIGAQKSATSWLAKCLDEHQDICLAPSKEIHYFSKDYKYKRGLEHYFNIFERCSESDLVGEFSTSYLSSFQAGDRIKEHFPNTKIIVSLRNPVERFKSHFKHQYFKNRIDKNNTIEEIIQNFPSLIENGLYNKYLKHYLSLFSKERIHIIFFKDIKNRPKEVVKKLYHFLEVDEDFTPDIINQKYNSSEVRSSYLFKKINSTYFFLKDYKIGRKFLDMLRSIGINSKTVQKLSYTFSKKEKIPYNIDKKDIYRNFFKDDIQKLEKLLNKDLSHWKY